MPNLWINTSNGAQVLALDVSLNNARGAIYAIVHRATGRLYIGMTTQTVAARWRQHCVDISRKGRNFYFRNVLRAYGPDTFDVHVIEHGLSRERLREREAYYIREYAANIKTHGFNGTSGGDGGYVFTDEVRRKIGDAGRGRKITDEQRAKVSIALRGRKRSAESIEKTVSHRRGLKLSVEWCAALSAAHLGNKATAEVKAKMSAAQKARRVANPGITTKHAEAMRRVWADPDYRARVGQKISAAHARPDVQAKLRAPRDLSDETRELLRQAANKRWNKVVRA